MRSAARAYRYDDEADGPTLPLTSPARTPLRWHVGVDLGLLLVRVALGVTFLAHGAQKMFGVFGGPGLAGFAGQLVRGGFQQASLLAGLTAVTELAGGALLLLGLATPLAAAGILAVMINAVWLKLGAGFFLGAGAEPGVGGGFEFDFVRGCAAAALVLSGGGRLALDRLVPMFRRPAVAAAPCLLVGAGAGVAVCLLLHG